MSTESTTELIPSKNESAQKKLQTAERTIALLRLAIWYLSLVMGLMGVVWLFWWLWPNRVALRIVTVVLMLFYVGWGVVGHVKTQTYSHRVLWEYVGVAGLGGLLLWLVL